MEELLYNSVKITAIKKDKKNANLYLELALHELIIKDFIC